MPQTCMEIWQAKVLCTNDLFSGMLFNLHNWNLNALEFVPSGL